MPNDHREAVENTAHVVRDEADGLIDFIDASPSPFHACATAVAALAAAGFVQLAERDRWPTDPGRYVIVRGGSLVAWSTEHAHGPLTPYRIVGAHTDSPNLRIKPQPDFNRAGWALLGVEAYGGPLLNSWLDRDLGLSGVAAVRTAHGVAERLFRTDEPLLRVPQLAIHLDREINERGLQLNKQQHLSPIWGVGTDQRDFHRYLADELEIDVADVLAFDLMTHDLTPSRRIGRDRDLVSAPRLDNLATSYAGIRALLQAVDVDSRFVPMVVLFDHEEVGSLSARGAWSTLLPDVLERVVTSSGGDRQDLRRSLADSMVASGDMAHATHPNYPERHEPQHQIAINGGPVLKINNSGRYATDAPGAATFVLACEQAGVPMQRFVTRSDLACGSTVGPTTAASLGVTTVDIGAPTLAMHSARELCGAADAISYVAALAAFLAPE